MLLAITIYGVRVQARAVSIKINVCLTSLKFFLPLHSAKMLLGVLFYWLITTSPNLVSAQGPVVDKVHCGIDTPACKCRPKADVCEFSLEISYLYTFTGYTINDHNVRQDVGTIYNIENGEFVPVTSDYCKNKKCTKACTVDGRTYRPVIAVNSQFPGPTLIVHEDQTVVVNVKNNLTDQDISIHWHGMFQYQTPWMDGVGLITQCPIGVGNTFRHIFKAAPTGTFWYHSHSNLQRSDGLFGGLIVMERNIARDYVDLPENQTITLLDWHSESSLELFDQLTTVEFFEGTRQGELPTRNMAAYLPTVGPDGREAGPLPYESGLMNGRGRHPDVPYNKTLLSIFEVESGNKYRFRLIGSTGVYGYRFSVDGHQLSVMAADGFLVEPVPADYIIIYPGERYDFILEANQTGGNYWIRAETLEVNLTGSLPYESLHHTAEAILHYSGSNSPPTPTEYEGIMSTPRHCIGDTPCVAVNCPFERYHSSYNITCINVHELRLLVPTPDSELPKAMPDRGQEYFFNFGFDGPNGEPSINARAFGLPPFPPQTQGYHYSGIAQTVCPNSTYEPNSCEEGCGPCVHVLDAIPFMNTVRLVLSAVTDAAVTGAATHPVHLHGHSFYVLDIGYGSYSDVNGTLLTNNGNISCRGQRKCPTPSWAHNTTFHIDNRTVRKDTVLVPAGGYVVIHFISDNPGWWFMHCHIEVHQFDGMALVMNEAIGNGTKPPPGFQRCGDFDPTLEQVMNRNSSVMGAEHGTGTPPTGGNQRDPPKPDMYCINTAELAITVVFVLLGFVLFVAAALVIGMAIAYKKGCCMCCSCCSCCFRCFRCSPCSRCCQHPKNDEMFQFQPLQGEGIEMPSAIHVYETEAASATETKEGMQMASAIDETEAAPPLIETNEQS